MDTNRLILQRNEMFNNKVTFWGRNRRDICLIAEIMRFPENATHSDFYHDAEIYPVLLKRKYLNRIRQKLLHIYRQGKCVDTYIEKHRIRAYQQRVDNYIKTNLERSGYDRR